MKFTMKKDFRASGRIFEAGNTYTAEKQGLDPADVMRWYRCGIVDVDGYPSIDSVPGAQEVRPAGISVNTKTEVK